MASSSSDDFHLMRSCTAEVWKIRGSPALVGIALEGRTQSRPQSMTPRRASLRKSRMLSGLRKSLLDPSPQLLPNLQPLHIAHFSAC